jgi:Circadian oscillating protein COP23
MSQPIWRRVKLLAGLAVLMTGSGLIVLPAGAQTTGSGDVIIDTEPQQPTPTDSSPGTTRFGCEVANGQYTVMYLPESQPSQRYPWATPTGLGGGWSADRRCSEISRRLEAYRPDGLLEMRTAVENGYNTICVTTQNVPACRIVLTVPPGQDPIATRDRVFGNLTVADSGQQTQAVNTFSDTRRSGGFLGDVGQALGIKLPGGSRSSAKISRSSSAINLRPFLDQRDGGTGERLRSGTAAPNRRLSPDRFR